MSFPGLGQGRGEIGETVASFPTYEGAQKAVSSLVAAEVPARDIAIVGNGLRSVERVTGKLGYATAARQGAINGLLLGLFFSAIFVLGNSAVPVSAFVGVLFVGVALGMLLSIGGYAIVRRRRDFASVTQVIAEHYEVTVLPSSIHRAREVLGPRSTAPRPPAPPASGTPSFGQRTDEPPRYGQRSDEPPRYGQRSDEPPRYGERVAPAAGPQAASSPEHESDAAGDADAEEPPRFGERIPAKPADPRPSVAPPVLADVDEEDAHSSADAPGTDADAPDAADTDEPAGDADTDDTGDASDDHRA